MYLCFMDHIGFLKYLTMYHQEVLIQLLKVREYQNTHYLKLIITYETKTLVLLTKSNTSSSTLINTIMEYKITSIWNKIKSTRDTFSKIALTKELDELVTQYKNELITKFQREKK